jgi:cytochrome c oxidase assembly protein subunit 15
LQGVLGGLRVIADEVQLAKIHGCVGPAFFAFTVALAAITSRRWRLAERVSNPAVMTVERLALVTTFLAYCQLVVGAQLRHLPAGAGPGEFRLALFFHLALAAVILLHAGLLAAQVARNVRGERWLVRPAFGLALAVLVQIALGAGTWVTKYGWPAWMNGFDFAAGYVSTAEAPLQTLSATAHVAIGSLVLATSLLLALRAARLAAPRGAKRAGATLLEAAL